MTRRRHPPPRYRAPTGSRTAAWATIYRADRRAARPHRGDQGARRAVRARRIAARAVHARGARRGAALGRAEHGHDLRRRRARGTGRSSSWSTSRAARSRIACGERRPGSRPTSSRLARPGARALDAAHRHGVVHRDVKPGNLLLNSRGEVAVADFGVASAVGLDSMTMTGTVLGTAGYLSPEQAKGERATPASDRYALGVVAYELLTGERPFAVRQPARRRPPRTSTPIPYPGAERGDLPPELDPVLRRALAKDPGRPLPELGRLRRGAARGAFARSRRRRTCGCPCRGCTPVACAVAPAESARVPVARGFADRRLGLLALAARHGRVDDDDEPQTRTVVETQVTTEAGQPTTVRETVTTAAATTSEPTTTAAPPPPPPPPPPSDASGEALTDQATALLGQRRWAEAEAVGGHQAGGLRRAAQRCTTSSSPRRGALDETYEGYAETDRAAGPGRQARKRCCDEGPLPWLSRAEREELTFRPRAPHPEFESSAGGARRQVADDPYG